MLTIRGEQMAVFEAHRQREFEAWLRQWLATDHPGVYGAIGEAGAEALVRKAIETGAARGIRAAGAVAVLLELMIEFGEKLERSPDRVWARNILAHPTLPDYVRVQVVRERLAARVQGRTIVRHR